MIRFQCPKCSSACQVEGSQAGRWYTCPVCQSVLAVPRVAEETAPKSSLYLFDALLGLAVLVTLVCAGVLIYRAAGGNKPAVARTAIDSGALLPVTPAESTPGTPTTGETPKAPVTPQVGPATVATPATPLPKPPAVALVAPAPAALPSASPTPVPSLVPSPTPTPAPAPAPAPALSPAPVPSQPKAPAARRLPVRIPKADSAAVTTPVPANAILFQNFATMQANPNLLALAPQVHPLPGNWLARNPKAVPFVEGNELVCQPGESTGLMFPIASAGDFHRPAKMTLTARLKTGANKFEKDPTRGAGLGFWSVQPSETPAYVGFRGVILNPDGQIALYELGGDKEQARSSLDWKNMGGWNSHEWHTVTIEVDTTPGKTRITNIKLDDAMLILPQKNLFTDSNVRYAGVYLHNAPDIAKSAAVADFSLVAK